MCFPIIPCHLQASSLLVESMVGCVCHDIKPSANQGIRYENRSSENWKRAVFGSFIRKDRLLVHDTDIRCLDRIPYGIIQGIKIIMPFRIPYRLEYFFMNQVIPDRY